MSLAQACRLGLGLIALSLPALALAADPALSGHIEMEVATSHQPAAGARIEVREAKVATTTDGNGDYVLPNLAPGVYTVIVNVKGQRPVQRKVTIAAGGPAVENFLIGADMKSLDQVNV
ncbi:MAG: carboxypeptidase regulatory-like domain-containing protein, partial [Rhodanobacter sp.]